VTRFIEDIPSFIDALAEFLTFFLRQMYKILAFLTTAAFILLPAIVALDKQQVTTIVGAIRMVICRVTTLVATGNNIGCNALPKSVVEHKVFSNELTVKPVFLYLFGIIDNAAFEVKYILKPMMQHIGTGFFAADTAGAVHNDIFILRVFQHVNRHG
jgi:hypothetical protein